MKLINFLNDLFKEDGFILIDYNSNRYVIGKPLKEIPIELQLLDKSLHKKLLFHPDLYFGEAYTNGSLRLRNGTLTEFLDIAFKNIGRADINIYGKTLNKIKGTFKYLTSLLHLLVTSAKRFAASSKSFLSLTQYLFPSTSESIHFK